MVSSGFEPKKTSFHFTPRRTRPQVYIENMQPLNARLDSDHLLIFGASARAAAVSALRAGLRPWCADLFADADLQAACPVRLLTPGTYPEGFMEVEAEGPAGPWMYTGGLENRPSLVGRLSRCRPLWGNDAEVLRRARSPQNLSKVSRDAGIPYPAVCRRASEVPAEGRWLIKPRTGAGGAGIHFWAGKGGPVRKRQVYFQQFIEGETCAAVFLGDGRRAQLLGLTHQLVGIPWLHARAFTYCGSIGPFPLSPSLQDAMDRLGTALVQGTGLRGLFGVDLILQDGVPWPVEVNPRYTASVEVLEYGLSLAALALHRQVFASTAGREGHLSELPGPNQQPTNHMPFVGKGILFARVPLVFPREGPWISTLEQIRTRPTAAELQQPPAFADIPSAGQRIAAGRPILTFFVRGETAATCLENLRQIAADLDRRLANG
jgi:predicted ATP-grasp superfamily ATP-dependent carboligase